MRLRVTIYRISQGKIMKKKFLFFILFLFTVNIFAIEINTIYQDDNTKDEDIEKISQYIEELDAFFSDQFYGVDKVYLSIKNIRQKAAFDWKTFQLRIPVYLKGKKLNYKSKEFANIVTFHEFTHALLHKNLYIQNNHLWNDFEEFKNFKFAMWEMTQGNTDQDLVKIKEGFEKFVQHSIAMINVKVTSMIISPYHELFADMAPVLKNNNPKAISDALIYSNDKSSKNIHASRNFTTDYSDSGVWNDREVHGVFGPTRTFLWEKYQEVKRDVTKAEYLRMIFEVIQEQAAEDLIRAEKRLVEMNYRIKDAAKFLKSIKKTTPQKMNRRFIKKARQRIDGIGLCNVLGKV